MPTRALLVVALLSLSLLALELAWTRIFSAEFFYTFAFLILSLAVLGLGLGALALRLLPSLARESVVGWSLTAAALISCLSPYVPPPSWRRTHWAMSRVLEKTAPAPPMLS